MNLIKVIVFKDGWKFSSDLDNDFEAYTNVKDAAKKLDRIIKKLEKIKADVEKQK